jgi:hypothetical protein
VSPRHLKRAAGRNRRIEKIRSPRRSLSSWIFPNLHVPPRFTPIQTLFNMTSNLSYVHIFDTGNTSSICDSNPGPPLSKILLDFRVYMYFTSLLVGPLSLMLLTGQSQGDSRVYVLWQGDDVIQGLPQHPLHTIIIL